MLAFVMATACGGGTDAPPTLEEIGAEVYRPGARGELVTATVDGNDFTYEVIDGLAILQGDMILGDADEVALELAKLAVTPQSAVCDHGNGFMCERWENHEIGYSFADDWGSTANNRSMRTQIGDAIRHWEQNTSFRFVERTTGDRVVFRNSTGCSSRVGRVEITGIDPQTINVSMACGVGAIIHEIGHAVGLFHEQSRNDRDEFVRITIDAVRDGFENNFNNHGGLGRDVGDYDYRSIMHYGCGAFSIDGRNTVEPTMPGFSCADTGQRGGLSEGDIAGVYNMYPPAFEITGATPGATDDAFELALDFSTEPVRDDYIRWTSDRTGEELGQGPEFTLRASDVPGGANEITASVVIAGVTVAERSIAVNLANTAPTVSLGADLEGDLNRITYVSATVSDAENGAGCPGCTFSWSPTPDAGGGTLAGFGYPTTGSRTVTLTVTDTGGATASDSMAITFVNSPPVPLIAVPTDGATYSLGAGGTAVVSLQGSATDNNEGEGPGPEPLDCSHLTWSSSVGSDVFDDRNSCDPQLTVSAPGARTITLATADSMASTAETSVTININDCVGNCEPDVSFVINTPEDYHDDVLDYPVYWLTTDIQLTATINDADAPPDNPIAYRWFLDPLCFNPNGCGDDDIAFATGTVTDPAGSTSVTKQITWTPEDDIAQWGLCDTPDYYRRYAMILEVTDSADKSKQFYTGVTLGCPLN